MRQLPDFENLTMSLHLFEANQTSETNQTTDQSHQSRQVVGLVHRLVIQENVSVCIHSLATPSHQRQHDFRSDSPFQSIVSTN
jgi:hypothetical protein